MNKYYVFCLVILLASCSHNESRNEVKDADYDKITSSNGASLVVLGNVQDAGSPQIGCIKECCSKLFQNPDDFRKVSSLGLVDASSQKTYLFDATPDIVSQVKRLTKYETGSRKEMVDGIFLTHAHIGHYTGLMYLGKESTDADSVPVYVMPRMEAFLSHHGPWNQLVSRKNIKLHRLSNEESVALSDSIRVTPLLVPHRDEYSETVGYRIDGPSKSALFIPDIDKWDKWERDISSEIKKVDYAFLDATFYSGAEINNRDIRQIPHPFVIESLEEFKHLSKADKNKIVFIHFNHTNPLLDPQSSESKLLLAEGFRIARIGDVFRM